MKHPASRSGIFTPRTITACTLLSVASALSYFSFTALATSPNTITVNSTSPVIADDGLCTLPEAIIAANTDTASGVIPGECPAGSGADSIVLQSHAIYALVAAHNALYGFNGLPAITSVITISGNGAIIQNGGANKFRLFYISPSANLTLQNLTVGGGLAQGGDGGEGGFGGGGGSGLGGAIYNQGGLNLNGVTLTATPTRCIHCEQFTVCYCHGLLPSFNAVCRNVPETECGLLPVCAWRCEAIEECFEVACPPIVVSRKTHGTAGTFDIDLPLAGNPGIECRSGGASNDYQVVFTFASAVTFNSAAVTSGTGTVTSTSGGGTPSVTVNLTGVTNAQTITLTLSGVNDGTNTFDVSRSMSVLLGDTSANGAVNSSDISQTKAQSGTTADANNFRTDVTVNGVINSSDISTVKSKSGTALP